jgi:polyphosphate kinase 2 (PPK2 family)
MKMPWLWRFWMKIPRNGQMAVFDRSWYGRVLIERVEALTPIPDWIRAYEEINEFEQTLVDDGCIFIEFWLHISREEQLRRFMLLSKDRAKAWQVSAEDWEHHRKYDEYLAVVKDMLANTHTEHAPWTVAPATDMNYRQFAVLKVVIETLERALDVVPTE